MGSLTPQQIDHYQREGYVVVPGLVDAERVERYCDRAREIAHGDVPKAAANRIVRDIAYAKGTLPLPDDPEHAIWKILNPDRFDPVLAECMRIPEVLDAVESLIGSDLLAFLLMFIYKPPGVAQSVHPFHQDAAYFMFGPHEDCLGVWIPLDPVDEENGSLSIVPRSHQLEVRQHEVRDGINAGAFAAAGVEGEDAFHEQAITLELDPGDCLLFHTRLLHRSGGNRTQRHRRVVTLHMANARCKSTGPMLAEYGFTLVRGQTYDGCLQPLENPELGFLGRTVDAAGA
ncbi:MAG: phytanoyl-CoA dioxygenase family protein [Myxococcota bacterium]